MESESRSTSSFPGKCLERILLCSSCDSGLSYSPKYNLCHSGGHELVRKAYARAYFRGSRDMAAPLITGTETGKNSFHAAQSVRLVSSKVKNGNNLEKSGIQDLNLRPLGPQSLSESNQFNRNLNFSIGIVPACRSLVKSHIASNYLTETQ